jgi:tetratricopeptide (TPR) repeat protein
MKNAGFVLVASMLLIGFSWHFVFSADEATLGRQAEEAGKLREALMHYVSALQSVPEGGDACQRLREKIISLVQKLQPPPAIPEEALKYEGRAEAAVRGAKTPSDFLDAAKEYQKALRLAPWVERYYFNSGVLLEKTGDYAGAIRNLKLYLVVAPNAQDANVVKKKIGGLEYEMDKSAKIKATEEEQQRIRLQREGATNRFKGLVQGRTYQTYWCSHMKPQQLPTGGRLECNEAEYKGINWYPILTGTYDEFRFQFDGRIEFSAKFNGQHMVGTVEASDMNNIRWTLGGKSLWVRFKADWSSFTVSYDRPADDIGYNPSRRYSYQQFRFR